MQLPTYNWISPANAQQPRSVDTPSGAQDAKQGNSIHLRKYYVELRSRRTFKYQLQLWAKTLRTKEESLANYSPSLILHKNLKKHNHYLLTLSNVSSKKTRSYFADLLMYLRRDITVLPNNLRIKWDTGKGRMEEYNVDGDTKLLKIIILGNKKRRMELASPIYTQFPDSLQRLLKLSLHHRNHD